MRFGRGLMVDVSGIGMKGSENVGMELFLVHEYCGGQNCQRTPPLTDPSDGICLP